MPTTTAPAVPVLAAPIIAALTDAGVGAFWDTDEQFLVAHRAGLTQTQALHGEHVTVDWSEVDCASLRATAWEPDGLPDYADIATVYTTPPAGPVSDEAARCARAVAEWFTTPRPRAGRTLVDALAQYGIRVFADRDSTSYAVSMDLNTYGQHVRTGMYLSVADRESSINHVPAAHTGWSVFVHDDGEPIGDPLYLSGDGELVDCAQDSAAAAAVIADFITAPISRHCDCYSQERYGRRHDRECNRYRRP
ncbi:hypothetical protein C6N75_15215 [Streptomyces solincola]|uniref:Uncharacterized protein n=1 Tax=Streptomyces solincola TaxID=2100817 RepID=A0A2S9PVD2_9ACTN|nr:hypothetical protein [Streptomyces solincola]PRH78382.1 hypothetical protein C6N75_15215 [Streptomyces solincola]